MTPDPSARVGTPTIPGARTSRPGPLAGPLLIAISVLHLACTPAFYGPGLAKIIDAGIVNAVESGSSLLDARAATFWYVVAGLGVGFLGFLVWWVERQAGTLPGALGWLLVAFTVINVALMPLSGFWLFLAPAAVVIMRSRYHDGQVRPPVRLARARA